MGMVLCMLCSEADDGGGQPHAPPGGRVHQGKRGQGVGIAGSLLVKLTSLAWAAKWLGEG